MISNRALAVSFAATLVSYSLFAADADDGFQVASADAGLVQEVIVTGTRQGGVKASDSPAPIQIIGAEEIQKTSSAPDLNQTLAALVPSFQAQTYGGDLSNLTLQARLRGLSSNDTLILINGKRRHTTGNLSIGGNSFAGGAGTDLNYIPVDAIDHVEVLTDGAAAQYGSDAIAGVINIILKKGRSGNLQALYGGYQDGGGRTGDVSGNVGFEPTDSSFLNFSAEVRNHGRSFRGAVDPRVLNPSAVNANVVNASGYPYLNRVGGDAEQKLKSASLNSGVDLGDNLQLYAVATYGQKQANAIENYRTRSQVSYTDPVTHAVSYLFPYGFTPLEAIDETDYQFTGGVKGRLADWNWDLASGYGRDYIDVSTIHSSNLSLYALNGIAPPSDFYDGAFKATQWTNTLDIDRDFDVGLPGPLNVAFGGEYRRDSYAIYAGAPASYFGAGAASFPGFNPVTAGGHARKNYAGYIDLAAKLTDELRVDIAGRYEHYSDFGNKAVGKVTGRYDFSSGVALRGTVSTGFRAPTLAEEYYTTTNVSPTSATVQLAPNSPGASFLGLGAGLQPETSTNYSFGVVVSPTAAFNASLDVYYITLKDRIVPSGTLSAALSGVVVAPAITQAIIANGNSLDPSVVASGQTAVSLFTNGVDTKTRGADLVLSYASDFEEHGRVDWSIGANYNRTTASNIRSGSAQLAGQPLFDRTAISYLTTASPRYVANFGALWTLDRLSVNLHEIIYGSSSQFTGDSGYTDRVAGVSPAHVAYYETRIGVTPVTNLDVSLKPIESLTLSIGAVNAFNRYPNRVNATLRTLYYDPKVQSTSAVAQYANFSPYGIDGGFLYVRARYAF